ncbi:hypothetical protein [uncultured Desulfobacter sp.]|nr:hypothetical protein [uncultured Desulfobacter sp.]
MEKEVKEDGIVTVLSVVGLIAMMSSFIPCLGLLAFFLGMPAGPIA